MALAGYDDFDPRMAGVPNPPAAMVPPPPQMPMGGMNQSMLGGGVMAPSDTTNKPPHPTDDAAVPPPPVPPPPADPVLSMAPMSEVAQGVAAGSYGGAPSTSGSMAPMMGAQAPSPFSSLGSFGSPEKRPEDDDLLQKLMAAMGKSGMGGGGMGGYGG